MTTYNHNLRKSDVPMMVRQNNPDLSNRAIARINNYCRMAEITDQLQNRGNNYKSKMIDFCRGEWHSPLLTFNFRVATLC
ncbi:MAG: hypothetical protein F6K17_31340 [Okeania sp. SIO3C4]|nr:hypothetical protein [Okeania sp. SIO3C4]